MELTVSGLVLMIVYDESPWTQLQIVTVSLNVKSAIGVFGLSCKWHLFLFGDSFVFVAGWRKSPEKS